MNNSDNAANPQWSHCLWGGWGFNVKAAVTFFFSCKNAAASLVSTSHSLCYLSIFSFGLFPPARFSCSASVPLLTPHQIYLHYSFAQLLPMYIFQKIRNRKFPSISSGNVPLPDKSNSRNLRKTNMKKIIIITTNSCRPLKVTSYISWGVWVCLLWCVHICVGSQCGGSFVDFGPEGKYV